MVINPDTGELLAAVSYPFPEPHPALRASLSRGEELDALLDRARYGLYPPGSTFKLVTAAAALRRDIGSSETMFTLLEPFEGASKG